MHAGDARRVRQRSGQLRDAQRRRVRGDHGRRRREALDLREQRELEIDALRRRLDDEVGVLPAPRPELSWSRQPRRARPSASAAATLPSSTLLLTISLDRADGPCRARHPTRRTCASRSRRRSPHARCRAPSCRRRARRWCEPTTCQPFDAASCPTISPSVVHRVVDLVLGVVEVRRDADAGARPVVDDDVPADQLVGDRCAVRHVEDHRRRRARDRRAACSAGSRPPARASISRRVSASDCSRIAGTPISRRSRSRRAPSTAPARSACRSGSAPARSA